MVSTRAGVEIGRVLDAAESASPVEAIAAVARELGTVFGAVEVSFLVADLSGRALVRLAHVPLDNGDADGDQQLPGGERRAGEESATVVPFDGGPAEQAVRTQIVQVLMADDRQLGGGRSARWRVLAPVTERGESIGVLELILPDEPDGETVAEIGKVAHLLAFIVIAARRHTDLFEWGQRTRSFSLSAEIQQRLLPGPHTCEAAAFTLSGWLEPAASIGGDTFDYSLGRDVLHLSLTDAMGHGVGAALMASLCLGSLRGSRRRGASVLEQAAMANTELAAHVAAHGLEDFVTGLLARVDLRTGSFEMVSAGHVAPYLARSSQVLELDLPEGLPFGVFADSSYRGFDGTLLGGDRVVLVTDGMLEFERNADTLALPQAIADTRELHPREVVRALADSVLEATGHALSDDATVLCLDWHGSHGEDRAAVSGADPERASDPLT